MKFADIPQQDIDALKEKCKHNTTSDKTGSAVYTFLKERDAYTFESGSLQHNAVKLYDIVHPF